MQGFASLLENRVVRHFLSEGMLENILNLWKRGLLVEKLFVLQRGQKPIEVVFGLSDDLADEA